MVTSNYGISKSLSSLESYSIVACKCNKITNNFNNNYLQDIPDISEEKREKKKQIDFCKRSHEIIFISSVSDL